jgi:hypothetical protein
MALRSILALAIALAACGGSDGPPETRPLPTPDNLPALRTPGARSTRLASYRLHAALDTANHRVTATGTIRWTNGGKAAVNALPFHLYLNAFKNEASVFMQESKGQMRGAHASTTHWGWIDVSSMKIAGTERIAQAHFIGPDQTVLELPLAEPLAPEATIEIEVAFTVQLPEVFARTGWTDDFHMVAQWFPKPGVRVGAPGH